MGTLLDMVPAVAPNDGPDAGRGDSVFLPECLACHGAELVGGSNLPNVFFREFGDSAPGFTLGSFLKPRGVRVDHLLSHGGKFEIAEPIVGSVPVYVVDGDSFGDGANKSLINQPMHKETLGSFVSVSPQPVAHGVIEDVCLRLNGPSFPTPESGEPSCFSVFVDLVKPFVAFDCFPHGPRIPSAAA